MTRKLNHRVARAAGAAIVLCGLALAAAPAGAQQGAKWIMEHGAPSPAWGQEVYDSLRGALCALRPGDPVFAAPGEYPGPVTIDEPVVITGVGSGAARFGVSDLSGARQVRIVTYNTHLFGMTWPLENFADETRARLIAEAVAADLPVVACFQEVWDNSLADIIRDEMADRGYPYSHHFNDRGGLVQHSGLLVVSVTPLSGAFGPEPEQYSFSNACGADALANKGFGVVRISIPHEPNGPYELGLFITHLQANDSACDEGQPAAIRAEQVALIRGVSEQFRAAHPGAEVVMLGDFNVLGDEPEYHEMLLASGGDTRDASRNGRCYEDSPPYTTGVDNDLCRYFNGSDCDDEELDYVLYTSGTNSGSQAPLRVRAIEAQVRRYRVDPPVRHFDLSCACFRESRDLSDHYAIAVTIDLHR